MRFTSTPVCNLQRDTKAIAFAVFSTFSLILVACGGGGPGECNEPPPRSFTAVQVQSMTSAETKTLTDVELVSLGTDIKYLSNSALAALRNTVSNPNLFWVVQHSFCNFPNH